MDFFHHHIGKDKRKSSDSRTSSAKNSPKVGPSNAADLEFSIESPPLVLFGNAQQSSGALLSGLLSVNVTEPEVAVESLVIDILAKVTVKKPVAKDCEACKTQTNKLKTITVFSEQKVLKKGVQKYPFSYLFQGHLPATTHGPLGSIDYALSAVAVTAVEVISKDHDIKLVRALIPPQVDRTPTRIFPPMDFKAHVTHPNFVHPDGEFNVQLRLSDVQKIQTSIVRWRLRKLSWSIHQKSKMISPACSKHSATLGGEGKGILHDITEMLVHEDVKQPWKSDWDIPGGVIEAEFPCRFNPNSPPVCDVETPTGTVVTHTLEVDLVVGEQWCSLKTPSHGTNSGAARILKMKFNIIVTSRAGLGISWDEEQPPVYEDVPLSPPGYAKLEDYHGEPLPDNDFDLQR